jgi:cyclic pyranopterin phosphate synthase
VKRNTEQAGLLTEVPIAAVRVANPATRFFNTIRLSVTPACNMACAYCNPDRHPYRASAKEPEFYLELVSRILAIQPFAEIQITGGEPALYPYLVQLIAGLVALPFKRVSITTNGLALLDEAELWQRAGLRDINVSLDAIDAGRFAKITGHRNLARVLSGIDQALALGLSIKLNCTVMRTKNENEILPLLEYAGKRGMVVRYLELMSMGPLQREHDRYYFSQAEILAAISERYEVRALGRKKHATASYWDTPAGRFGIIANHSDSFCADCDRLRILHDGRISGCLSSENTHSISEQSQKDATVRNDNEIIKLALDRALSDKAHWFTGSSASMQATGG